MLTYKQLKPVLYTVAKRFTNHKYEIDELINEVWLLGNVQKSADIRLVYRRCYYDIIDYLRTQEGRKEQTCLRKPSNKYRVHFKSMDADTEFTNNGEHDTYKIFMGAEDENLNQVDFDDDIDLLLKKLCNSPREKLIVRLKLKGYKQKEIGLAIGLTESRISKILKNIGKSLEKELVLV